MIAYIKGTLSYKDLEESLVVLETGGVGYGIFMSGRDMDLLPGQGEEVRLYTHFQVKEDGMQLYGFFTREDQKLFKLLLGVSGIGPKGALGILGALSPEDLRFAILADDAKTISRAPGIGHKTAQKLILELKDKLKLEDAFEAKINKNQLVQESGASQELAEVKNEAVEALTALGYSASEALRAVRKVDLTEEMSVEAVLKAALKYISF